jgi:tetratricopeptide (TPR) repeat protein
MRSIALTAVLLLAAAARASSPVTFADPDGQELILEELSARTAIHGMLSLTELEFRFRNPRSRVIEGRFSCTLPPNASISRFAKEVNGHLVEGEVVERLRANQVYEQYLHVMRDPALLEQDQGNRFSARIFPINPNERVRLILSWTQLLPLRDGVRTYTLPLRGLPKVNKLTFRAIATPIPGERPSGAMTTTSAEVTTFEERDWTPDRDVVMSWRATESTPQILRAGEFYIASLRPPAAPRAASTPHDWLFYVDTSASAAEGATHRIKALESLLEALPPSDRVQLLAFDNEVVPLAEGTAAELSRTIGERLRARLFLGGTDVVAMLRDLSRRVGNRTAVIVSDLVPTLGETSAKDIQTAAAALPGSARVHALVLGSREEAAVARAITANRGRIVRVPFSDAMTTRAAEAVRELQRAPGATVEVRDPGAEWVYPTQVHDVAAGDELLVLGRTRPGEDIGVTRDATVVRIDTGFAPLLEREAYRAYLQYLAEREASEPSEAVRRALATEQVKISVEQRVVIPRTTMLVLENEFEYQRFGIDRRALADILTIDASGIAVVDRSPGFVLQSGTRASLPVRETDDMVVSAPDSVREAPAPQRLERTQAQAPAVLPQGVFESITITNEPAVEVPEPFTTKATRAPAPPPRPRPPTAPPPPPAPKRSSTEWTRATKPPRARIAELEAKLRDNPRDRDLYNELGEALAAWEQWSSLRALALRWQPYDPENPQVYELLGAAAEARGDVAEAARAYASLIEIAPAKTELLQRAGLLLLRTNRAQLAEAPLRRALEVRPDRANGYRHLALMLWSSGRTEEAARVLESATKREFPNWYRDVQRVIREELGYVYRAMLKNEPARRVELERRARDFGVDLDRRDALRITLVWETDANDVDLHVVDPSGEHCYYQNARTKSGLRLYEDITQGLGPEVIAADETDRGTYHVGVRYFAAGPMGISRGVVVVMTENGAMEIHPFRLGKEGGDIRYVTGVTVR